MQKKYIRLPHTADLKLQCFGSTQEELFRNALIGMFESCKPISDSCTYRGDTITCSQLSKTHSFLLEAPSIEILLVDFLSEALYFSDAHNEAYLDADILFTSTTALTATIKGVQISGFGEGEIKAVTFNELRIEHHNNEWHATIVFDL